MSSPENSNDIITRGRSIRRRRRRIAVLAVLTTLLFGLLFVQSAFNTLPWLKPTSASETLILYSLSTVNLIAFIVLLMVLVRNIIKLNRERAESKLGAKFKTRLVKYSIALSLLPVIFLFFATSGLINRSVDKWFSEPAREMVINARQIQRVYQEGELDDLKQLAATMARLIARTEEEQIGDALASELKTQELVWAQVFDQDDRLIAEQAKPKLSPPPSEAYSLGKRARAKAGESKSFSEMVQDAEGKSYLIASAPIPGLSGRLLVIAQQVPQEITDRIKRIDELEAAYDSLKRDQNKVKNTALLTLALITLLTLFIAFWLALYLARTVADPVRQLAEATEYIKRGDLSYRAGVVGDDELAALAASFNEMTAELAENRQRLELSTEELQRSNAALEGRRNYIEAILQSLSAGVISLDENGHVTTINGAAKELLRIEQTPVAGVSLEALLPEEQREELRRMIRRAARLRSVTREVHFTLANHAKLDAAVTVTALRDSRGAVIVIEDLTELIEAQRRAAWSEVARRMAHEIKNPLTPIRLSAERLAKNLIGGNGTATSPGLNERQTKLVRECTAMIGAEVSTLQRMVDEFSDFARLPNAKLEPASLDEVIARALKLYDERLDGVQLECRLAAESPVLLDAEQIKRVLVNLIDNAAEALAQGGEQNGKCCITVSTRELHDRDAVELTVADTGPGIPPADRERIFDPYFSTRKRGTGLGLAIVSRIVAEHQGRIRVQENTPRGAKFIIELPNARGTES
ncbi:MAG TPA: ATP-binding protein [Blastocatellia bacterium]|nr:ATP-binding protein [Blastocatellia bacterium]HMZ18359.1 ATP-binding protein [Blastocatellia bacterium]HNG31714.1 ATP-binding protein [Blastocatellia bacterium]